MAFWKVQLWMQYSMRLIAVMGDLCPWNFPKQCPVFLYNLSWFSGLQRITPLLNSSPTINTSPETPTGIQGNNTFEICGSDIIFVSTLFIWKSEGNYLTSTSFLPHMIWDLCLYMWVILTILGFHVMRAHLGEKRAWNSVWLGVHQGEKQFF